MKVLVLVGAVLALASPAHAATKSWRVQGRVVEWRSPERFGRDEGVAMRVLVNGREAIYEQSGRCVVRWYRLGASITTNVCHPRLRLRAVSTRRVRVTLRYWRG